MDNTIAANSNAGIACGTTISWPILGIERTYIEMGLSEAAAKALEGKEITDETATAAGAAAAEGAKPLSGNEYKVQLLKVAVKRAALLAAGVKPYWEG